MSTPLADGSEMQAKLESGEHSLLETAEAVMPHKREDELPNERASRRPSEVKTPTTSCVEEPHQDYEMLSGHAAVQLSPSNSRFTSYVDELPRQIGSKNAGPHFCKASSPRSPRYREPRLTSANGLVYRKVRKTQSTVEMRLLQIAIDCFTDSD